MSTTASNNKYTPKPTLNVRNTTLGTSHPNFNIHYNYPENRGAIVNNVGLPIYRPIYIKPKANAFQLGAIQQPYAFLTKQNYNAIYAMENKNIVAEDPFPTITPVIKPGVKRKGSPLANNRNTKRAKKSRRTRRR